jgi:Fic family protein
MEFPFTAWMLESLRSRFWEECVLRGRIRARAVTRNAFDYTDKRYRQKILARLEEQPVSDTPKFDPRVADAEYVAFPPFSDWKASVDAAQWEQFCSRLREHRKDSPEVFQKALNMVTRATAVDTGAIEDLYKTDRGFTFTVAMELASWEMQVADKGAEVMPLLEAQFKAYDYVLDLATRETPITETWIRELHAVMCAGQEFFLVVTSLGPQPQRLPKGEYKSNPNHVRLADGGTHAYAPVDMVTEEMHRFCQELRSEMFEQAHPVIQAAYAHYAFVAIHPFADGNGRLARAIASIFTLRAESIPVMVLFDTRAEYYTALQQADQKKYQPFTDFVFERSLEGVQLASESFEAAKDDLEDSLSRIQEVYASSSNYARAEIDSAAERFSSFFEAEVGLKLKQFTDRNLEIRVFRAVNLQDIESSEYRNLKLGISLSIESFQPVKVQQDTFLFSLVPVDLRLDGSILLVNSSDLTEKYECRISEIIPNLKSALRIRISIMVERFLNKRLAEFADLLEQAKSDQ